LVKNFIDNQLFMRLRSKLLSQILGLRLTQPYLCHPFKKPVAGIAAAFKQKLK